MNPLRRALILAPIVSPLLAAPVRAQDKVQFARVMPRPLMFPRDHGAHPEYRTEWWYLTGWLDGDSPLGFQVTFFRARTDIDPRNPSRFAARQLIIAHGAIADAARGSLLKDERVAREGFGVAYAAEHDTDVRLDRWLMRRRADGSYECEILARGFSLRFTATPTQPLLLQGEAGFSRKGPLPEQASHYYTQPHLSVRARVARDGVAGGERELSGVAWLDHEWSSTILDANAAGWDWIGMNLDDGGALTAFDIRPRTGEQPIYAYASLRAHPGAAPQVFGPNDVRFTPLQRWVSPRTRAAWPVSQQIRVGDRSFVTQPLMADQELDSRQSTGAVYWEGASRLLADGRPVGRGYLEMTGYVAPIEL